MQNETQTPDRTACYAMQMKPLTAALLAFVNSKAKSLTTMHDLSGDWPEHTTTAQTYTRKQVASTLTGWIRIAKESAGYCSHYPSSPNMTGLRLVLQATRTVKDDARPELMQALANVRNNAKRAARKAVVDADLAAAKAAGATTYTFNGREYTDLKDAAKAHCRHADNYGADWWTEDKAARLAASEAAILGEQPTSSVPEVVAMAHSMGAPKRITTEATARKWLKNNL